MKSQLVSLVAIGLCCASSAVWASGFATIDPEPRQPKTQTRGTAGNTTFVGTIESINISNMTVEVYGNDARIRASYMRDERNRQRNHRNQRYEPTRTLENTGQKETRTFVISGFCHIRGEDAERRIGTRLTIADLQNGQQVSIDYIKGVGERYTAHSIVPMSTLKLTENTPKKK